MPSMAHTPVDSYNPIALPKCESWAEKSAIRVGRNDPCPCGSGKKFKKCCLDRPPLDSERATPTAA
jgi:hypothetical protein